MHLNGGVLWRTIPGEDGAMASTDDEADQAAIDERWMSAALSLAREAAEAGEVPVGAVAVISGTQIAGDHNRREALGDPTAHAEMLVVTEAASSIGSWRLEGVTLYVTLEPCAMCAGAVGLARIDRLVYGAPDPKAGACGSVLDVVGCAELNHRPEVRGGVLAGKCGAVLSEFFAALRGSSLEARAPAAD